MNDIGIRVRDVRKRNNFTQTQFSELIGISQGNLSEIELGNSKPSADTLISISVNFNVDLNWLLLGSNDRQFTNYQDDQQKALLVEYGQFV